ncbi:protein TONSOKU isoform X2 [Arachis ipaensis]|uniref:protein TONSOKU isoform X2 n=1 Tax=Arachis ipaensis TaxID=130454 RepID=UPI000A2B20EC|nr:protein TONSOKU isoform X2 [Arachis ipaensis]XP_025637791.1 protein TONSOKU isoform X2 [Arachis hypogaea]
MPCQDSELKAAKTAYRSAKAEGNHREEARWANVIGDIHKNRGEYVEALKWLRIDYDVSLKYLLEKDLLPTCQSIGEMYLRLEQFSEALTYQKKHLELAREADDVVEQQRASTQLGRTYHELFSRSDHDHNSIRNAKKYFNFAMELAVALKKKPPSSKSSFLKEYIDAHNNKGMLEMELDNLQEAKEILTRGLEICDEEEVSEFDDGRSRLHHNLGNVYMELRNWNEARWNIKMDIQICNKIGHRQGEAKGYINLGELHSRTQKYEEAISFYNKALGLARSLEDEDALVRQIEQNIRTVKEAVKVMDEIKKEEQNLKKLKRDIAVARGTPNERKCLLQQNGSLERLVEKSRMISAWEKHCEFAKEKKRIASELCDKQRLGDSYMDVGESYQKLRKFNKAIKRYKKSWEMYQTIGSLEGQALVKINIGNVLDSAQKWREALDAYTESYRIAVEAQLPDIQLSALENMHYSNMIRFDDESETKRLKILIDKLKNSIEAESGAKNMAEDCCSETDTEADNNLSIAGSDDLCSPHTSSRSKALSTGEEFIDDMPLMSIYQSLKGSSRKTTGHMEDLTSTKQADKSSKSLTNLTGNHQAVVGRKRVRVILSDDEEEMECSSKRSHDCVLEDRSTYDANMSKVSPSNIKVISENGSKLPINVEESSSSFKCWSPHTLAKTCRHSRSMSNDLVAELDLPSGSKCNTDASGKPSDAAPPASNSSQYDKYIECQIGNDLIHIEATWCTASDKLDIESLKAVAACLYYLQLPTQKRSDGLLPVVQHILCAGRDLESLETVENLQICNVTIEASIDGWIHKRLIKMYVDFCKQLSEKPNMKVLKKLYNLEVSDDEIVVSECDLQDLSITPLINALQSQKAFSMLDLSHNLLGNGTMEALQKVFTASDQHYGDLTLDLHCNRFGPTALLQICECSVLFDRLEVLNISGNRLTDACGSYLSTILKKCKGHNSPVSGNTIVNLLSKLSTLKRFSELNLSGLKLGKPVVDALCQLAGTLSLSGLILGGTSIGTEGVMQLAEPLLKGAEEFVKLDLSYCGLTSNFVSNINVNLFCSILELNLEGNPVLPEGGNTLCSLLVNPSCSLKVLVLRKCQLGLAGVLHIIEALAENNSLEELNLADNTVPNELYALKSDLTVKGDSEKHDQILDTIKLAGNQEVHCSVNLDYHQLEVADSEDETVKAAASGIDDSASSCQRNSSSAECLLTQQLAVAIGKAKKLQLLDLSNNAFSLEAAETFYNSWTSVRVPSQKHINEGIMHFSTKEKKCCRVKPCCKKVLPL